MTKLECTPQINWVKLDPKKHNYFYDGSRFLVAVQVHNWKTKKTEWEFDVVVVDCDGDGMFLKYEGGDLYDKWDWFDFEYFCLLEGDMPFDREEFNGHEKA